MYIYCWHTRNATHYMKLNDRLQEAKERGASGVSIPHCTVDVDVIHSSGLSKSRADEVLHSK
jgi:hypothetical protein